jgi:hypothetical protein
VPERDEFRSTTGLLPKFMVPAVRLCIKATGNIWPLISVNPMYRRRRGGGPTPNLAAASVSRMISFEPVSTSKFAGWPLIWAGIIILFSGP